MTDQTIPAPIPHPGRVGELFQHTPIKRLAELRAGRPPKVDDMRTGFNAKVAVFITTIVGTMWAAYIFTVLALISFPSAISSHDLIIIISWIAQTFLQLVLLPIIIVGQNIQGKAADRRAEGTYKDAEAILQECLQLQAHLQAQDKILDDVLKHLHEVAPPATA
jgi:hypothetical protein